MNVCRGRKTLFYFRFLRVFLLLILISISNVSILINQLKIGS